MKRLLLSLLASCTFLAGCFDVEDDSSPEAKEVVKNIPRLSYNPDEDNDGDQLANSDEAILGLDMNRPNIPKISIKSVEATFLISKENDEKLLIKSKTISDQSFLRKRLSSHALSSYFQIDGERDTSLELTFLDTLNLLNLSFADSYYLGREFEEEDSFTGSLSLDFNVDIKNITKGTEYKNLILSIFVVDANSDNIQSVQSFRLRDKKGGYIVLDGGEESRKTLSLSQKISQLNLYKEDFKSLLKREKFLLVSVTDFEYEINDKKLKYSETEENILKEKEVFIYEKNGVFKKSYIPKDLNLEKTLDYLSLAASYDDKGDLKILEGLIPTNDQLINISELLVKDFKKTSFYGLNIDANKESELKGPSPFGILNISNINLSKELRKLRISREEKKNEYALKLYPGESAELSFSLYDNYPDRKIKKYNFTSIFIPQRGQPPQGEVNCSVESYSHVGNKRKRKLIKTHDIFQINLKINNQKVLIEEFLKNKSAYLDEDENKFFIELKNKTDEIKDLLFFAPSKRDVTLETGAVRTGIDACDKVGNHPFYVYPSHRGLLPPPKKTIEIKNGSFKDFDIEVNHFGISNSRDRK